MRYCILITLLFVTTLAVAQEVSLQFEQANQSYRSGDFQKSIEMYEMIVKNGYESSALYYNLGNAYFKSNNIPAAILNYERAKRLAPHDEDIAYNLKLANLRVIDKIEPVPQLFFVEWWNGFVHFFSVDGWSKLLIVSLWCMTLAFAAFFLMRRLSFRKISLGWIVVSIALTVLSLVSIRQGYQQLYHQENAIIFSSSVSVKSAPDEQSTDLFVLHEGVRVEVLDSVGNWRKVRLSDGKVGWLLTDTMKTI